MGFTRIRHYGLLAPCHATTTLERARASISPPATVATTPAKTATSTIVERTTPTWVETLKALTGVDARRCPRGDVGHLERRPLDEAPGRTGWDTS